MDGLKTESNVSDVERPDAAGGTRSEPVAPNLPQRTRNEGARSGKEQAQKTRIFAADLPQGPDALGLEAALRPLAELAVHRGAEAPLTIGLLGEAGTGKSFALGKLMAAIDALSAASAGRDGSPFLHPVLTVTVDARALSEAPVVSLAAELYDRLASAFPDLAREAAHAVRDPQVVAREAAEQLDIGRRRLDTERQNLAELESRRARLSETVLFEQPGSQVDAYVRANRAKIESRLESFGIKGDPVQNYKSMVRDIAESGGPSARAGTALRAFWSFKGQTRLLVTAAILILIGFGCGIAMTHQQGWLGWLRGSTKTLAPSADWLAANIGWLTIVREVAFAGAALAVVTNIWRGIRFLRPLFRGVSLLESEVTNRRLDLDGLYAHQMRRVDALAADVELTGRRAAEADRRAMNAGTGADQRVDPSPFDSITQRSQAERFFAALADAIQRNWRGVDPISAARLPQRIIIGIDNIDRLPSHKVEELLSAAERCLGHSAFVTVVAADPHRLAAIGGDHLGPLEKWLQIPVHVGPGLNDRHYVSLVAQALGHAESPEAVQAVAAEAAPLDWTVSPAEEQLLTGLAPLAGRSPRAIKRFINLYRVARSQASGDEPALAFMLALDQGGRADDIATVRTILAAGAPDAPFVLPQGSPQLDAALAALRSVQPDVTVAAAARAARIAQSYSLRV